MQAYELKRGHAKLLGDGKLRDLAADVFGSASEEGGRVRCSFGAIESLVAWIDGKSLFVETTMRTVPDDVAGDTIRRFYLFLERATGYTSKQRRNRLKKKAKDGTL